MQGEKSATLIAYLLLLLVALIWGFGFVAQRAGMEHMGPYAYNGIRFLLGGLCLLPLAQLAWGLFFGALQPNPVEALLHGTGDWALRLLLVTLAVTPLK